MDLVIEDDSRVDTVYFMMQEEDVKKNIALPWVSFGSDRLVAGGRGRVPALAAAPAHVRQLCAAAWASMFATKR